MFLAFTDANGYEMWKSDGTASGTRMVRDINGNSGSSYEIVFGSDSGIEEINAFKDVSIIGDTMYFAVSDANRGRELWKTDGTYAGTVLVRDINLNGQDSSDPANFTTIGSEFYFSASTADEGRELWVSGGDQNTTHIVMDINPGSVSSSPGKLTYSLSKLFFTADNGVKGTELWVLPIDSDGDGFNNDIDNCIFTANPLQANNDLDAPGDADDDNDGYLDDNDAFPFDASEWLDTDQDTLR